MPFDRRVEEKEARLSMLRSMVKGVKMAKYKGVHFR